MDDHAGSTSACMSGYFVPVSNHQRGVCFALLAAGNRLEAWELMGIPHEDILGPFEID
jgi:hypothetical protein